MSDFDVGLYENNKQIDLSINGNKLKLVEEDLLVRVENMPGYLTAQSDGLLVTLNTQLSEELISEGYSREFVNKVQGLRKELGFVVTDKIKLCLFGDRVALKMVEAHKTYVSRELLANSITRTDSTPKNCFLFEFNDFKLYIGVELV